MIRKFILSAVLGAGLAGSGAAWAQAAGDGIPTTPPDLRNVDIYGPLPGTPEYYGNSGYTPPVVVHDGRGNVMSVPRDHPQVRSGIEQRDYQRYQDRQARRAWERRSSRDRDGDGVLNRHDRWPYDPTRS